MHEVKVQLDETEFRALFALAKTDLRTPNAQVRWLIRQEAARRGLIELETLKERNDEATQAVD